MYTKSRIKTPNGILYDANYICVGSKHKGEYIHKSNLVYIEAYENYAWLHLCNGTKQLSCKSIGYYEEKLAKDNFTRIHRSYLVNLSHVKSYESKYRLMHLKGEIVLPLSFRKNRLFSKMINNQQVRISFSEVA